jgi:hypothetical protein
MFREIIDKNIQENGNWEYIRPKILEELAKNLKSQKGIDFRLPR